MLTEVAKALRTQAEEAESTEAKQTEDKGEGKAEPKKKTSKTNQEG